MDITGGRRRKSSSAGANPRRESEPFSETGGKNDREIHTT